MKIWLLLIIFLPFLADAGIEASDIGSKDRVLKLQNFEPNIFGLNSTRDEVFADIVFSQSYPLFHDNKYDPAKQKDGGFFFATSIRFGFYMFGTRDSSPVVGKRFNPELFYRRWINENKDYWSFGYGHESNGQRINSEDSFNIAKRDLDRPELALDAISRGWDYLGFSFRKTNKTFLDFNVSSKFYIKGRYFLSDGILQGEKEEQYWFETDHNGLKRSEVDGLTVALKLTSFDDENLKDFKALLSLTTGYESFLTNKTFNFEITYNYSDVPITFFYRDGYNSDLAHYYENDSSFGITLELRNFIEDI